MFDLSTSNTDATVVHKGRSVASLHEYLRSNVNSVNVASKLLTDLHSARGIGQIFVQESNMALYYYNGNEIYHIFSRGGRVIIILARPALSLTSQRRSVIQKRFLPVDETTDRHLISHFEKLLQLSGAKVFGDTARQFISGEFKIHMRDLQTPFIELGIDQFDNPLVVPLQFIPALAAVNVLPHTSIKYMGQHILLATNEDYTVRVMYVSHLLDDKLFIGSPIDG